MMINNEFKILDETITQITMPTLLFEQLAKEYYELSEQNRLNCL